MDSDNSPKADFRLTMSVYRAIHDFIGLHRAERGGMLGRDEDGVIRHFAPDPTACCNSAAYDPDLTAMNRQIRTWKGQGIEFCGFAHSHPANVKRPSAHDVWYAGEILPCFKKLELLWLPIVMTEPDTGEFEIFAYAALPYPEDRKRVRILHAERQVLDEHPMTRLPSLDEESPAVRAPAQAVVAARSPSSVAGETRNGGAWRYYGNFPNLWATSPLNPNQQLWRGSPLKPDMISVMKSELEAQHAAEGRRDEYLLRLAASHDLHRHDETRLVVTGLGGAQSFVRNAARMGYGEYVLFDPDHLSPSNVATQQADPRAIGRTKVDALAEDILAINPAAAVLAISGPIEAISDSQFDELLRLPLRATALSSEGDDRMSKPRQAISFGLTDNFWANARTHRLGLHFGLPTVCAQEYVEGRGAEVTYTVPGVTPACHRCITSSRYRAYLQEGYVNDVTSDEAPVFAAEILNGVLGHILLALTYHGTDHPRWGGVIDRLGCRNLIRIRMDPDFDDHFGNTFEKRLRGANEVGSFFMLDSLFLPQTPDMGQSPTRPRCPDCGGYGDLGLVKGTFHDTRIMRQISESPNTSKRGG